MSVEQRLSELQSKAQAVADECHRLGLLVNQGVKTTDSPDFAGLTVGSNTVWHAGNDGAGSGLDADTVDGRHAASFAYSGILPDGADLNEIKQGGMYRLSGAPANSFPTASWGNLLVIGSQGADTMTQIGCPYASDEIYFRRGTWATIQGNPWKRLWHSENAGKLLWSGSWSSGNITIADVAEYTFFNIMTNDTSAPFIGVKSANGQILAGFMVTGDTGVITTRALWITISGTTLTYVGARGMTHNASGNHGSLWSGYSITAIYGGV